MGLCLCAVSASRAMLARPATCEPLAVSWALCRCGREHLLAQLTDEVFWRVERGRRLGWCEADPVEGPNCPAGAPARRKNGRERRESGHSIAP